MHIAVPRNRVECWCRGIVSGPIWCLRDEASAASKGRLHEGILEIGVGRLGLLLKRLRLDALMRDVGSKYKFSLDVATIVR